MVPTYDFPSTSFDFQFPPLSKPALLSTSQSLLDIPDLSRLPSPTWSLDDNAADIMPADPKGKKHQIEEVEDKTSKTKPHNSTLHSPTGPCALRADCTESDGVRTDFAESVCTPHELGGVRADSEVSVRTPHKNCMEQGLNQGLNPGTNSH
jgi:hypothetical protein